LIRFEVIGGGTVAAFCDSLKLSQTKGVTRIAKTPSARVGDSVITLATKVKSHAHARIYFVGAVQYGSTFVL
jgi:hypothetical protein